MSLTEIISLLISALTIIGTVIAVGIVWGRLTERLQNTETRMKEDRETNSSNHEEFQRNAKETVALATEMKSIGKQLETVQTDIREILDRLPARRRSPD
jgi:predicted  nucleic acid-binding Zn-ribbon protein